MKGVCVAVCVCMKGVSSRGCVAAFSTPCLFGLGDYCRLGILAALEMVSLCCVCLFDRGQHVEECQSRSNGKT